MTLQENIEKFADSVKAGNLQRRYWMVRTNSGTYFDLFVEKGYVALNRNDIPYKAVYDANQEYDKPDLVVKKVKQTIKESANFNNSLYADERALSVAVSQVYKFVYDIHKGDVVIIPAENSNKICIGLFEEDFIADNKQTTEKFVYTRKVKWIKQLEKRYFDPFFYKLFTSHQAICDVGDYKEYIERCICSQFVINDESHYVIALTSETIKARHLFKFGDLMLQLFEEYIQSESLEYDVNGIDASINLNSPGRIDFKSNVKMGALLMLFIPAILTDCTNVDGHQATAEIYNSIATFKNNHQNRLQELDSLINSLQVKKIEDSFNIVNNDD
ncbi:hypothetical protein [Segatella copri]|jgi:restriction system protein|uniref:hypothetical protein n=1 Tax=Segatella copri TaxID=165179 RepID=UPI0012926976|nr:hypothetical protein [Segatella copri]MQM48018.1 hypothetical protein [Segatella copri]MQM50409.1 hypothetical protein [Segatella copri]MQM67304.1 hypothetical protein [Segatella copri]MQM74562.1 hypothetical protein [Segatella copri]MQM84744.1 hypothetical protein [Segatella copri]